VVRLGLSLRCDRFTQRQNLCHDWLNLARVDQVRDLAQIFGIRTNPNGCSANPTLLELGGIGARDQMQDDATFFHHAI
jgi:hypothetical protein